jgi:hypothetical protein
MQNEPYPQTCIVNSLYANRTNKIQNEGTTCTGQAASQKAHYSFPINRTEQELDFSNIFLRSLSRLATTFRFDQQGVVI